LTAFWIIGCIGVALLAVSLVLGDVFDFDIAGADWFSGAALGGFVAALGFGAALADGLGGPGVVTGAVGVGAGLTFGWFAAWLTRVVRRDTSGSSTSADDTVGRDAVVVTAIPEGGFGTVKVILGGQVHRYNARAETALVEGTAVHVTGVLSPTALTVAPVWSALE
jgi:membrane protein implicated in regulation of membrane protease activity